jgi:hypothetical protein
MRCTWPMEDSRDLCADSVQRWAEAGRRPCIHEGPRGPLGRHRADCKGPPRPTGPAHR